VPGKLPSEVMKLVRPKLDALAASMPPGYILEIGGSEENVVKVAREAALVAIVSIAGIFLALVIQLKSAIKPAIGPAAIPFGGAGALAAIVVMDAPFGFTAILGTISLIGVIVSHIIVLFDYIEEAHERGEPLEDALRDAGVARLRPVLITVGATVFGLVPLAVHGGPLWEALCYAQIGGPALATPLTPRRRDPAAPRSRPLRGVRPRSEVGPLGPRRRTRPGHRQGWGGVVIREPLTARPHKRTSAAKGRGGIDGPCDWDRWRVLQVDVG